MKNLNKRQLNKILLKYKNGNCIINLNVYSFNSIEFYDIIKGGNE